VLTDHKSIAEIVNQTTLDITDLAKINPKLILASAYLAQYRLDIRYIAGKINLVLNALSRLLYIDDDVDQMDECFSEFDNIWANVLTKACIEIEPEFKYRIIAGYEADDKYQNILKFIELRKKKVEKANKKRKTDPTIRAVL